MGFYHFPGKPTSTLDHLPNINLNFAWHNLSLFPCVSSLVTWGKKLTTISLLLCMPVLFNVLITDLDTALESMLSKFAQDIDLGGTADSLEAREVLQRDLDKRGLSIYQLHEGQQGQVLDFVLGPKQPWIYVQMGTSSWRSPCEGIWRFWLMANWVWVSSVSWQPKGPIVP